eukprot:TRINITY_DN10434_c0_g2_i4.p1 TRINITY_DN10434_c0_g2~~TRINITY_DN10434_c0_g2_i4.p1  ORF type:complete len:196 (+),score=52.69 TRINITY_DN10434_c0_g2_i4:73-588(+)
MSAAEGSTRVRGRSSMDADPSAPRKQLRGDPGATPDAAGLPPAAVAEADGAPKEKDSEEQLALKFAKQLAEVTARLGGELEGEFNSLKDLFRCCESLYPSLKEFLEANGITRMEVAKGDKFDPSRHCVNDEYFGADAEGMQPGTIVRVRTSGYMYRGKVLRPADCVVVGEE